MEFIKLPRRKEHTDRQLVRIIDWDIQRGLWSTKNTFGLHTHQVLDLNENVSVICNIWIWSSHYNYHTDPPHYRQLRGYSLLRESCWRVWQRSPEILNLTLTSLPTSDNNLILVDKSIVPELAPEFTDGLDLLIARPEVWKILEAVRLLGGEDADIEDVGGGQLQNCPRDNWLGVHGNSQPGIL